MIPLKIRNGFVTNSSSSSFIIGKANDNTVTIDSVYQEIKEFYKQYYKSCSEMYSYVETYYPAVFEVVSTLEGKTIHRQNGYDWRCTDSIDKQLKAMFGTTWYDDLPSLEELSWTVCETYTDYEQFWIQRMQERGIHAPFYIRDFSSNDPYIPLDFSTGITECIGDEGNGIESDILAWYFPWIENIKYDCDSCPDNEYCYKEECQETKQQFMGKEIPRDQACLYILGKICICSECGYIPDFIVKKLSEMSEYSCNHMG